MLDNLGGYLNIRFHRMGNMEDLRKVIDVSEVAVATTPLDHTDHARKLMNVGLL